MFIIERLFCDVKREAKKNLERVASVDSSFGSSPGIYSPPKPIFRKSERILSDFPDMKFFLNSVPCLDYGEEKLYLITGFNKNIVCKDIGFLERYILAARRVVHFPPVPIDLHFKPPMSVLKTGIWPESIYFKCNPYTKTGKLSKYPLVLHIQGRKRRYLRDIVTPKVNDFLIKLHFPQKIRNAIFNLFWNFKPWMPKFVSGTVHYLKNSQIGKAHIVLHKYGDVLTIDMGQTEGKFNIKKIKFEQKNKPMQIIDYTKES